MAANNYPLKEAYKTYLIETGEATTTESASTAVSKVAHIFSDYLPEIFSADEVTDICTLIENGKCEAIEKLERVDDLLSDKIDNSDRKENKSDYDKYYDHRSRLRSYLRFLTITLAPSVSSNAVNLRFLHKDVVGIFKSRIRTQNRPISDSANPCFPIALILWAAKQVDKSYWRTMCDSIETAAKNVHLMTGNGVAHVNDIDYIELKTDGTVWVKVDEREYQVFTPTATGSVAPMTSKKTQIDEALAEMDLDHFTPISNLLNNHNGAYPKLLALTQIMVACANKNGIDVKASSSSLKEIMKAVREDPQSITEIAPLFPDIVNEFCKILQATTFTLMDATQNNKKGNGSNSVNP